MAVKDFAEEVERLNISITTLKAGLTNALGNILGDTSRDATVYHIKLDECENSEELAERLVLIFGEGAKILLNVALKECKVQV
jgi:hypothetical protein